MTSEEKKVKKYNSWAEMDEAKKSDKKIKKAESTGKLVRDRKKKNAKRNLRTSSLDSRSAIHSSETTDSTTTDGSGSPREQESPDNSDELLQETPSVSAPASIVSSPATLATPSPKQKQNNSKIGKLVTKRLTTRETAKLKLVAQCPYGTQGLNEVLGRLVDPVNGVRVKPRKVKGKVIENTWRGKDLIDWFVENEVSENREKATSMGSFILKQEGIVIPLTEAAIKQAQIKLLRTEIYTFGNKTEADNVRIEPYEDEEAKQEWDRRNVAKDNVPFVMNLLQQDYSKIDAEILKDASVEQHFNYQLLVISQFRTMFRSGKAGWSILVPIVRNSIGRIMQNRLLKSRFTSFLSNDEMKKVLNVTHVYHERPYLNDEEKQKLRNIKYEEASEEVDPDKDWSKLPAIDIISEIYKATYALTQGENKDVPVTLQCFDTLLILDSIDVQTQSVLVDKFNQQVDFKPGEILAQSCLQHPMDANYAYNRPTRVVVEKIFTSIARPVLLSFRQIQSGTIMLSPDSWDEVKPRLIYKQGDNLMQDYGVETMFKIFNAIWADEFPDLKARPFAHSYEVFPTGKNIEGTPVGFMEVVDKAESFKTFSWAQWVLRANDDMVDRIVTSAAGSYAAGYVLGVRDRHWDNIMIRNKDTLLHIDFGFVLGTAPPIDAPKLSISTEMKVALSKRGKWEKFVSLLVSAYLALRKRSAQVIYASKMVFGFCLDRDLGLIEDFMSTSLELTLNDEVASQKLRQEVEGSSVAWQNFFKQFSHKTIDPVWYGLLRRHFPPAVAIMDKVEESNKDKVEAMKSKDEVVGERIGVMGKVDLRKAFSRQPN